ncbi:flagellin N-terminal helical domain-containing protein [Alicyclobacillus acidocaldarius]|uniref:Flagellin n=1 Tax=Alicyclobacillus acidocaldarius subsp. acidocaldarius (strain ATCC 27009 / DSM 446 / BCRC 14685 / JCM 5260 / KCTC 1825 / NBRC 15652 / NCIMB 11725 / NRRL B-14509 / 104-IA) TaxID=521098 RepID=C8WT50_ALIAD|nr:flagellin [Alicyclobacillus acidocaldarius]ACV59565.1 flagellin domain protein [Alicyclobacillus acidocaldarius subsp. acidocaldarius DSM 446]
MSLNFSVNNNASAASILSNLQYVNNEINTSYQQLSTGNRINSAADDPAGYAISQQMTAQVNALNQAIQNAQNGISMLQTASGAMNQITSILQTMNTLAVEAANGTENSDDLNNLDQEFVALQKQIDNITSQTKFNTKTLLDGTFATSGVVFQINTDSTKNSQLSVTIAAVNIGALFKGHVSTSSPYLHITSQSLAQQAISLVQAAITSLSSYQAQIGAVEDRLNYTVSNLQNTADNLQNAESTITNTDMAQAYTQFSQQQVLQQVGLAMLAQADQQPDAILKLLQ